MNLKTRKCVESSDFIMPTDAYNMLDLVPYDVGNKPYASDCKDIKKKYNNIS